MANNAAYMELGQRPARRLAFGDGSEEKDMSCPCPNPGLYIGADVGNRNNVFIPEGTLGTYDDEAFQILAQESVKRENLSSDTEEVEDEESDPGVRANSGSQTPTLGMSSMDLNM